MNYASAVKRLTDDLYDSFDLEDIYEIVEFGLKGVAQMTNTELVDLWSERFGEELVLSDPEENPNK